jgi:CO/xanthine dehydrogenase FAD-binding subunit
MMGFEPLIPESLDECLGMLARYGNDARVVAGGTDLFILMKTRMTTPRFVIPLGRIESLKTASRRDGAFSLGAGLTHSQIAQLGLLEDIRCLRDAARSVGSPQIRNAGTAGGNLANASPAADLYPPLLALGARLEILRHGGKRTVGLDEFVKGPGMTVLMPGELIGSIVFQKPEEPFVARHEKVGLRNALAVSVTSAAVVVTAGSGKFRKVTVACGAVAPTSIRMRQVEKLVEGEVPSEELLAEAARVASSECDPITDIRATGQYRRRVTGVIVSRLLRQAARELLGYGEA